MSSGYQIDDQYGTYFITPTIVDWVDLFSRQIYRDIIIDSLKYCIEQKGLVVYGYVLMTNHLHLIVRSQSGKLSRTIQDFKKFTASSMIDAIKTEPESRKDWLLHRFQWNATLHQRGSDHQVWTHENHAEAIFSEKFFNQKLNYIHNNPVRAGWVENPEEYIYSSAKALLKDIPGKLPVNTWGL